MATGILRMFSIGVGAADREVGPPAVGGGAMATPPNLLVAAISSSMLFMLTLPDEDLLCKIRMVAFLSAKVVSKVLMVVSISAHFRYYFVKNIIQKS